MRSKYTALFIVLVVITNIFAGCAIQKKNEEKKEDKYVPVETETVEKRRIANVTTISGKTYPNKDIMVVPKVPGKVTEVRVSVGERVKEGDILFTLDKSDVQNQINQAKAALQVARSNYEMTREKIDNAKQNLERTRSLYEEGAASKSQLEQAELAASDSSLSVVGAQVDQAETAYQQTLDALSNLSVTAPIDGVVSSVNIEAGEMASNAQPSMTIVDMDRIYVLLEVTENIVSLIKEGQKVILKVPALDNKIVEGNIDSISPVTDSRTQLYPVKVYLSNEDGAIKPGMFAQVDVETGVRENVTAVKSEALVLKNGRMVAYVVEDSKAVEKEVTTGLDTGTYIEVTGGLETGEELIVKGQNYVTDGINVKTVGGSEQ